VEGEPSPNGGWSGRADALRELGLGKEEGGRGIRLRRMIQDKTYETWSDKRSVCVTLHEERLPELLSLVFGKAYIGYDAEQYYLLDMDYGDIRISGIFAVLLIYSRCLTGALVLDERGLDLIQEVVGEHGPALLPFTNPQRARWRGFRSTEG